MYRAYRQLKPFALDELGGRFPLMQKVSVRCMGVAKEPTHANMHHKFLVLGRLSTFPMKVVYPTGEERVEQQRRFCPEAAWLGSYNFTWNASRSLESAVIVRDEEIARRLRGEFCAILEHSEPLPWKSQHVAPEFWVERSEEG
jgi:phosphatidylserine/phosphatidylglycerophosphate/cardiolipin synthase-like enzyme